MLKCSRVTGQLATRPVGWGASDLMMRQALQSTVVSTIADLYLNCTTRWSAQGLTGPTNVAGEFLPSLNTPSGSNHVS